MPRASSGGPIVYMDFAGFTVYLWIEAVVHFLRQAGWVDIAPHPAFVVGEVPTNYNNGDTVSIAGQGYTFKLVIDNAVPGEILRGLTIVESLSNLAAAVNGSGGAGYSSSTPPSPAVTATVGSLAEIRIEHRIEGSYGVGVSTSWGPLVDGGYALRGTSPQSPGGNVLTVQALILDHGDGAATVQFVSDMDPTRVSRRHVAHVGDNINYRIHAGPCQFFIWQPGVFLDPQGSPVCGGIPWVAEPLVCQGVVPGDPTTEAWWIASGRDFRADPRISLMGGFSSSLFADHNSGPTNFADACWNGNLQNGDEFGVWQILPIKSIQAWEFYASVGAVLSQTLWLDGSPLQIEPLVAWALHGAAYARIRGQLWDSWESSKKLMMDTTYTDALGDSYVRLTDRYYWGCLELLLPHTQSEIAESNYAY